MSGAQVPIVRARAQKEELQIQEPTIREDKRYYSDITRKACNKCKTDIKDAPEIVVDPMTGHYSIESTSSGLIGTVLFITIGAWRIICWMLSNIWHYEKIFLSLIPMFILLGSLIAIYLRLEIGLSDLPWKEKIAVRLPFSVYLGWITVAPIANVSAALVSINCGGFGISDVTWTIQMIISATTITILVVLTRRIIAFGLVMIWALGGIIYKQINNQNLALLALICEILIVTSLVRSYISR